MTACVKRVKTQNPMDSVKFSVGHDGIGNYTMSGVVNRVRFLYEVLIREHDAEEVFFPITSFVTGEILFMAKAFVAMGEIRVKLFDTSILESL